MKHAIRHEINVRVEENPAFYQSLRQRLEEIIEQRRRERVDAAEQLSLLNGLREQLKGEQDKAQEVGLDGRGFAIYGLLKEGRPIQAGEKTVTYEAANRELASLIDEAVAPFTELVDWHQKEDVQRGDGQQDQEAAPRRRDQSEGGGRARRLKSWTWPRCGPSDDGRLGDLGNHLGGYAGDVR